MITQWHVESALFELAKAREEWEHAIDGAQDARLYGHRTTNGRARAAMWLTTAGYFRARIIECKRDVVTYKRWANNACITVKASVSR